MAPIRHSPIPMQRKSTKWISFMAGNWLVRTCMMIPLAAFGNPAAEFKDGIAPILEKHCFDCHADGTKKGGVVFDEFASETAMLGQHELWLGVLKNVRSGLMPPPKKTRLTPEERQRLEQW